jgi:hypothetical protein
MDENFDFETNLAEFSDDTEMIKRETLTIDKEVVVDAFFVHGFAKLRAQDGITHEMIEYSLCQKRNRSNVFKAGEASGASGSFFFFSHDKLFVIKTMTPSEREFFFSRFGKSYFNYFEKNPNSFIARIYGVFTVKMSGHAPIHLMMLAHTLRIPSMDRVLRIYDIKGSTVNREVKIKKHTSRTKTLKDVNFMKLKKTEPLNLAEIDLLFVTKQLAKDTEFLKSQGIMDYSLLLAVEKAPEQSKPASKSVRKRNRLSNAINKSNSVSDHSPTSSNNQRIEIESA